MPKLLLNLRYVPDDEAEDVRELLEERQIQFYETAETLWASFRENPLRTIGVLIGIASLVAVRALPFLLLGGQFRMSLDSGRFGGEWRVRSRSSRLWHGSCHDRDEETTCCAKPTLML